MLSSPSIPRPISADLGPELDCLVLREGAEMRHLDQR
jgi:hypothetical protein